jgi:enolase-phosphatase E1
MISFILTDIEGTTTSIKFVYDVLFPYFKKHFLDFYQKNLKNIEVQNAIELAQKTILEEENKSILVEESLKMILHWAEIDRKHTALKILQGLVWKKGYEKGEILGHIYPDVPPSLEKWKNQNIGLGIYSSGSVSAQKLLFGTTEFGNLNPYFSHYFDTNIGHKREKNSYQNIQKTLNLPANDILFLSDIPQELASAQEAGFQTIQLVREGTLADENFKKVKDFSEISF